MHLFSKKILKEAAWNWYAIDTADLVHFPVQLDNNFIDLIGGQIISVGSMLGLLSYVTQRREFTSPLSLRYRDFSIGINMGSDSIP